jgi:hypothetical protein
LVVMFLWVMECGGLAFNAVRRVIIERADGPSPTSWEPVCSIGAWRAPHWALFAMLALEESSPLHRGGLAGVCVAGGWRVCADLPESDGRLQVETKDVPRAAATHLKVTIASGWGDFATVNGLTVEGNRM